MGLHRDDCRDPFPPSPLITNNLTTANYGESFQHGPYSGPGRS